MAIRRSKGLLCVGLLLLVGVCGFGVGALGLFGGFGGADLGEDVEEDDDADIDETHYEDGLGLDFEAGAVLGEVAHVA